MPKLCDLIGVRAYHGCDDYPVQLWRHDETGRLVIRAYNEAGYNGTEVDLLDLVDWLKSGPTLGIVIDAETANRIAVDLHRDSKGASG